MFRIGDFSRLARVTIKTLHHYDEIGLLTPAHVEDATGYRYYTAVQLETLQRILLLKDLGFTLEEIRDVLDSGFEAPQAVARFEARRAQLVQSIDTEQARLRRLDALRASLLGEERPAIPPVILRDVPPTEVHFLRRRVERFHPSVQQMFEAAEAAVGGARGRGDVSPFLIFHDAEYRETDADVEVCVPVKPGASQRIETRIVPAIQAGCVTYRGSYEQTPVLYEAMLRWIERSGFELSGPLREVYHRFGADQSGYRLPDQVIAHSSADYITELQAPVSKLMQRRTDREGP